MGGATAQARAHSLTVRSGRGSRSHWSRAGVRYGAAVPTRPYPFERLPHFTREQLRTLQTLRSLHDQPQREIALRAATTLLGAEVSLGLRMPESHAAHELIARLTALGPCVGVLLECSGDPIGACMVLELSAAFAERLVDRALGGDGAPELPPTLQPLDELSRGALAYAVARVVAALGSGMRLRHITHEVNDIALALGAGSVSVCAIEVRIGADSGSMRLYAPAALTLRSYPRAKLHSLETLPLTLIARVGSAALAWSEIAALHVGDVVVLDESSLAFDGAKFGGHVVVHVAGSGTHLLCALRDRGVEVESLTCVKEPSMSSGRVQASDGRATVPDLAADAPIELGVELARFSLTLGELQRTRPGDVLITGRAIGEAVTLRAGGRAIAQGDLVDVDGEIGVRITQFLQDPG
jgi:type III secretion protein Q